MYHHMLLIIYIIVQNRQLLGEEFSTKYKPTVQEMYQRKFMMDEKSLILEIEDTSGMFAFDFPAMFGISLRSADVVLLVFSVDDEVNF